MSFFRRTQGAPSLGKYAGLSGGGSHVVQQLAHLGGAVVQERHRDQGLRCVESGRGGDRRAVRRDGVLIALVQVGVVARTENAPVTCGCDARIGERDLRALEREERELLGMRVRQLIDDETFQRERTALQERRLGFAQVSARSDESSRQQARIQEVTQKLDLVEGAPAMLRQGEPFQLRSLLQQLQLEINLRGRRLDFTALEPLRQLVKAGSDSNWCTVVEDVRTWLLKDSEGFSQPDLRGEDTLPSAA